jgi:hypothetical protein
MKAALIASLALTTLPLAEDVPRLVLEEGDMLSSAWDITTTRETIAANLGIMGNDQDVGSGSINTSTRILELSDEFPKVDDEGSPLTIVRSYETLNTGTERGGEEREGVTVLDTEGESDLTGSTVVFTYDPESEEWSAAYAEDAEGEEEWLEDLAPRVDLSGLLGGVEEDLEVGGSWSLPPSFLSDLLDPGGAVIQLAEPEADDAPEGAVQLRLPGESSIKRYEDLDGDLTATLAEITEEDDTRVAKIVVKVDVEGDLDVIEDLEEEADERGSNETYLDGTLARTLEGEFTILWNLTKNRPESIEGELSGSAEMDVEWSMSAGADELEITFHQEVDVTHEIEATFGD